MAPAVERMGPGESVPSWPGASWGSGAMSALLSVPTSGAVGLLDMGCGANRGNAKGQHLLSAHCVPAAALALGTF